MQLSPSRLILLLIHNTKYDHIFTENHRRRDVELVSRISLIQREVKILLWFSVWFDLRGHVTRTPVILNSEFFRIMSNVLD